MTAMPLILALLLSHLCLYNSVYVPFEIIESEILPRITESRDKIIAFSALCPWISGKDVKILQGLLSNSCINVNNQYKVFGLQVTLGSASNHSILLENLAFSDHIPEHIRSLKFDESGRLFARHHDSIDLIFRKCAKLRSLVIRNLKYQYTFNTVNISRLFESFYLLSPALETFEFRNIDFPYHYAVKLAVFLVSRKDALKTIVLEKVFLPQNHDEMSVAWAIRKLEYLEKLVIQNCLSIFAVDILAESMTFLPRLKHLTLQGLSVGFGSGLRGLVDILKSIGSRKELRYLNLSKMNLFNRFSYLYSSNFTVISLHEIGHLGKLEYLDLSGNQLNDLRRTFPNICDLSNLKSFIFANNFKDDEQLGTVRWLSQILGQCFTKLEYLDVSQNHLKTRIPLLLSRIPSNSLLNTLNLAYNDIGHYQSTRLWFHISRFRNLRHINLSGNLIFLTLAQVANIDDEYFGPNLESLDLSDNMLFLCKRHVMRHFLESISPNLKHLNLDDNRIYKRISTLIQVLPMFSSLESISLRSNDLDRNFSFTFKRLCRALARLPSLRTIYLDGNNLGVWESQRKMFQEKDIQITGI